MTDPTGDRLAKAAADLLGAPFRLHGRDPATGLDCVGVALHALQACGIAVADLPEYAIRKIGNESAEQVMVQAGFSSVDGPTRRGDILFARTGPAQLHLLIAVDAGSAIHAHAGLGRVIVGPTPDDQSISRIWRYCNNG